MLSPPPALFRRKLNKAQNLYSYRIEVYFYAFMSIWYIGIYQVYMYRNPIIIPDIYNYTEVWKHDEGLDRAPRRW